jgi:hypothetical protein
LEGGSKGELRLEEGDWGGHGLKTGRSTKKKKKRGRRRILYTNVGIVP